MTEDELQALLDTAERQGFQQGLEQGIQQGLEQGIQQERTVTLELLDYACKVLRDSGRYATFTECRSRAYDTLNILTDIRNILRNQ
jgi:hypothetical protein